MSKNRQQINAKVLPNVYQKLQSIQEETGLSQTKIIEMLINNYNPTQPLPEMVPTKAKATTIDEEKLLAKLLPKVIEHVEKHLSTKETKEPEPKPTPSLAPKPEIDPEVRKELIRNGDWIEDDDEYELSEEDKRRIAEFEEEEALRQAEEQKYWDQQDLDSTPTSKRIPTPEPIKPPSSEDLELMELIRQHEQEWMD